MHKGTTHAWNLLFSKHMRASYIYIPYHYTKQPHHTTINSWIYNNSPIGMQHLPRYIRGIHTRSQENVTWCNLNRLARPSHWNLFPEVGTFFFIVRWWNQRCPNRARRHPVHPYTLVHQLEGEPASECHDCPFGRCVVQQPGVPFVRIHWGGVDDAATFLHVLQRMPVEAITKTNYRLKTTTRRWIQRWSAASTDMQERN